MELGNMLRRESRGKSIILLVLVLCGQHVMVSGEETCCWGYCNNNNLTEAVCDGTVPYSSCSEKSREGVCTCEWSADAVRCVLAAEDTAGGGPNISMIGYIIAGVVGLLIVIIALKCWWIQRETAFLASPQGRVIQRALNFRKGGGNQATRERAMSLETASTHFTGEYSYANSREPSVAGRARLSSTESGYTNQDIRDPNGVGRFMGDVNTPAGSHVSSRRNRGGSKQSSRRNRAARSQESSVHSNGGVGGVGGGGLAGGEVRTVSSPTRLTPAAGLDGGAIALSTQSAFVYGPSREGAAGTAGGTAVQQQARLEPGTPAHLQQMPVPSPAGSVHIGLGYTVPALAPGYTPTATPRHAHLQPPLLPLPGGPLYAAFQQQESGTRGRFASGVSAASLPSIANSSSRGGSPGPIDERFNGVRVI